MAYQNDLSTLNNDFSSIHNRYADKLAGLHNTGMMNRASDLAKQSADLVLKGQDIAHAVEGGIGSVGAKHLVDQVIKPFSRKVASAIQSRFGGGGESAPAPETDPAAPSNAATPDGGSNTGADADSGGGQEMSFRGNKPTNQFTRDGYDSKTGLKSDPQADPTDGSKPSSVNDDGYGETKTSEGGQGESKSNWREGSENATDDAAGDADGLGDALADAGGDAASDAAATAASAAADALAAAGTTAAETVASAAAEIAAADWWNPVGWVAAAVAAGGGIYAGVEAGESAFKAGEAGKKAAGDMNYKVPSQGNLAGRYITPVLNNYQG